MRTADIAAVLGREREYHERLYSGEAQRRFAQPAVRAFRAHLCSHILRVTGVGSDARVLSAGCGIGDMEITLAPQVRELVGVDLSPAGICEARASAARAGLKNVRFVEGTLESPDLPPEGFDLAIAIFFLHHLPDPVLADMPRQILRLLAPGGWLYALDPSRLRLSGAMGSLLIPWIMKKHQSPDERELGSGRVAAIFQSAGLPCNAGFYDFLSTPMAGLFPGWRAGYRAARCVDELLIRAPLLRRLSSNFEIVARKPS